MPRPRLENSSLTFTAPLISNEISGVLSEKPIAIGPLHPLTCAMSEKRPRTTFKSSIERKPNAFKRFPLALAQHLSKYDVKICMLHTI